MKTPKLGHRRRRPPSVFDLFKEIVAYFDLVVKKSPIRRKNRGDLIE